MNLIFWPKILAYQENWHGPVQYWVYTAARVSYVVHRLFVKAGSIFLEKTSIMRDIYYTQWWQTSRSGRGHQKSSYPLPFSLSGPGELKARTLDIKITVPVCRSIEPRLEVRKTSQNLFVRFLLFNKKNKQHENVNLEKLTSKKWISCTSVQKAPQQAHMYMHTHTHTCPHMHIYTCTWYT